MPRLLKALSISALLFLDVSLFLIFSSSPIAKFIIEKYDVDFLGREVEMNTCLVNPLTGKIWINGLTIYEHKSNTVFLEAEQVNANFEMLQLLSGKYEVSNLSIHHPSVRLVRNDSTFNISDIVEKFTPDPVERGRTHPVEWKVLNVQITKGQFKYVENEILFLTKNIAMSTDGLCWDTDTVAVNFAFESGKKTGAVVGKTKINLGNLNYVFALKVVKYDLDIINQYLNDITNYGVFTAQLNAEVVTSGNFKSADSIQASGMLAFNDFHFGKNPKEDFASFEELKLSARKLNPNEFIYDFQEIALEKPFLKYELYEELDNIQLMFGERGSKASAVNADPKRFNLIIEIAQLIEQLARNVLRSDYELDHLAIRDGNFQFVDYSIPEPFMATASPFHLFADSIYKRKERLHLEIDTGIQPQGSMHLNLSVDPKDSAYFDMRYQFQGISMTMFNPYIVNYTSYPFERGTLSANGNWKVRKGMINSKNHLVLNDPKIAKRVKNTEATWIPVPLLMAFAKERGDVIDYEIPIKGSLRDPNFKLWDIASDAIKNIFMKLIPVIPKRKS